MRWTRLHETAPEGAGNVIQFGPYRHKAARQRRWAWWVGLLSGVRPHNAGAAKPMPAAGSPEVLKFRKQAGAHW